MGAEEVNAFLTSLAVEGNVSASTQNQALSALLFLYRSVLEEPLPWMNELVRAQRRGARTGGHDSRRKSRQFWGCFTGRPS